MQGSALPKTNIALKMMVSNRNLLLEGVIFRCYVSLREVADRFSRICGATQMWPPKKSGTAKCEQETLLNFMWFHVMCVHYIGELLDEKPGKWKHKTSFEHTMVSWTSSHKCQLTWNERCFVGCLEALKHTRLKHQVFLACLVSSWG